MDMRTDLTAVPHAGLGYHFLRVQVGNHWSLGVLKRRNGPKRKKPIGDHGSNKMTAVRAHLRSSLALYKEKEEEEGWPPAAAYNAPRCTKQVRLHKHCMRVFVGSRLMQAPRAPC